MEAERVRRFHAFDFVVVVVRGRWVGFDAVGEEMLHCVAPRWLPLMRSHERRALHDEILAAMPPTIAIRVLVPALSPSSTATGRDLDERSKTAVATEAARALAAALERGIARDIVSNLSPTDGVDAIDAINALMSAADRLELPPGSHSCVAALHPTALARTVATQLCESCRLAVTKNEGESAWLRVKESGFTTPAVGTSVSRRRERWVERKAPAIKSANMFRWQALITGKVGV